MTRPNSVDFAPRYKEHRSAAEKSSEDKSSVWSAHFIFEDVLFSRKVRTQSLSRLLPPSLSREAAKGFAESGLRTLRFTHVKDKQSNKAQKNNEGIGMTINGERFKPS